MQLNWCAYTWDKRDGYGRFGVRFARALIRAGVDLTPISARQFEMPGWLQREAGIDTNRLTISIMPPIELPRVTGRHWLYTMTEGSELPAGWAEEIWRVNIERIIVPSEYNVQAFEKTHKPVHVVLAGTDPAEFPIIYRNGNQAGPYTFLALADRGARKGWVEVWEAFFQAFGTVRDTPDVRLLIKARPTMNPMLERIAHSSGRDPRISIWIEDVEDVGDVYGQADCFLIPARSEGWGMPQREAAMMGLPVVALAYGGVDDGRLCQWADPLEKYTVERIPESFKHIAGDWARCDIDELARTMRHYYDHPQDAARQGQQAAFWLRNNQTWDHAAQSLIALMEEYS